MLRCPRLFWNVSPRSLSITADGHAAAQAQSNCGSTGALSR